MKLQPHILFLLIISFLNQTSAQKYDNNWVMGYGTEAPSTAKNGFILNFNSSPPDTTSVSRYMWQGAFNNNISNKSGELQFYTNGCSIAGADDQMLLNGDSINIGEIFHYYCFIDYPIAQAGLIFPDFSEEHIYHFFHMHGIFPINLGAFVDGIWYSQIDMEGDDGHGEVVVKNDTILQDTMRMGQFTATRHANGRDWWIIAPLAFKNGFVSFLFSPNGISHQTRQEFDGGIIYDPNDQAVFSPDGSKYVRIDPKNGLHIYDFDRCTGVLSDPIHINLGLGSSVSAGGVAISSNSRYLYATAVIYAYQFDLWADDIPSSKILVAEYDGYGSPFYSTFYLGQLCADEKIYFNCTNGEDVLHVIHEPNKAGIDCNFAQHDLKLPYYNANSSPNFPYYYSGPLVGSSCDTLFLNTSDFALQGQVRLFPNPVIKEATLAFSFPLEKESILTVSDVNGAIIVQQNISKNTEQYLLDLDFLLPGIYFYYIRQESRLVFSGKLMKL